MIFRLIVPSAGPDYENGFEIEVSKGMEALVRIGEEIPWKRGGQPKGKWQAEGWMGNCYNCRVWIHNRSRKVKAYLAKHPEIVAETLPAYAPELNPDEGVWGWIKYGRLANLASANTQELRERIHQEFETLKDNPVILYSFIQEADLCTAA